MISLDSFLYNFLFNPIQIYHISNILTYINALIIKEPKNIMYL